MSMTRCVCLAARHMPLRSLASRSIPVFRCAVPQSRHAGARRAIHGTTARHDNSQQPTYSQIQQAVPEVSGLPASTDLLELYRGMVTAGRLKWDDEQVRCIIKLKHLLETLEEYEPPIELLSRLNPSAPFRIQQSSSGWWKSNKARQDLEAFGDQGKELIRVLSGEEELSQLSSPKGILITGPPGTGKSLLLSLFYHLLPTTKKRRVHYHAFTLGLYRQVFQEMQRRRDEIDEDDREVNRDAAAKKGWRSVFAGGRYDTESGGEKRGWTKEDTIPFVIARNMILEYHILYFDEMQLIDASSAALLRDVLSWYWRLGGVIVSCSNRVPDDLYHHGIQRDRMASFLDALKSRCEVVELDGGRDWRRGVDEDSQPRANGWFELGDEGFDRLWEQEGAGSISVYGRRLAIPRATDTACRFTFSELCEEALGPADYISLASTYRRMYIDEMPVLLLKQKNEARRLINLLDALYESRCQLHVRAAAPPEALFFPDAHSLSSDNLDAADSAAQIQAEALSETLHAPIRPNVSVYNYSPSDQAQGRGASMGGAESDVTRKDATRGQVGAFSVLGIFTGEDERFAYKRAVSRLIEMTTSPTYAHEEWLPLDAKGRTWETANQAASMLNTFQGHLRSHISSTRPHGAQEDGEDFAVEAGYSRPSTLVRQPKDYLDRAFQAVDGANTGGRAGSETAAGATAVAEKEASGVEGDEETAPLSGPEGRNEPPAITHQNRGAGPRVNPPVIGEQHVWGTQEGWGPKAGKWGQGAEAFKKGKK